jgi:hypothetical protein
MRDLAAVGAALLVLIVVTALSAGGGSGEPSAPDGAWTFVSIPDFLNADIAADDADWEPVLDYVLDEIEGEQPDFVVVPGDLVMGWWSTDPETIAEQGRAFYGDWRERFEARDLVYYPVVGDHEIGDNPWPAEKARAVPAYKQALRDNLDVPGGGPEGGDTIAYTVQHKNLRLVALDVFEAAGDQVRVGVTGEQLEWARSSLSERAPGEHLIVAGHVPILASARSRGSSRIRMSGGAGTPIWDAISEARADLYIAGEMHDISVQEKDGVMQVVHGSAPAQVPEFNYLITRVFPDRLELELKALAITLDASEAITDDPTQPIGVPGNLSRPELPDDPAFRSVGTMVVTTSPEGQVQYTERTGYFESRYRAF